MINYIIKENGIIKNKKFESPDKGVTIGLTSELFLSVDEMVYDIITNRLTDNDKKHFKSCTKNDLYKEHLGFGMWIRNSYGLWEAFLINFDDTERNNPESVNDPLFPDNTSFKVMELVCKTLRGEYTPDVLFTENDFDNAMKIVGGE